MEGKEEGPAARHSRSGVGEGGRRGREGAEGGRGQRVGGAPIQSPAREGEDRPRRWVRERRRGRGRSAGGRPASCLRAEREQGGRR